MVAISLLRRKNWPFPSLIGGHLLLYGGSATFSLHEKDEFQFYHFTLENEGVTNSILSTVMNEPFFRKTKVASCVLSRKGDDNLSI